MFRAVYKIPDQYIIYMFYGDMSPDQSQPYALHEMNATVIGFAPTVQWHFLRFVT